VRPGVPEEHADKLDRLRDAVRRAIASLRVLMVDIYPDLSGPGLATAIEQMAGTLREEGVDVDLQLDPLPELSPRTTAILYRAAKETLRNVVGHAKADFAQVRLEEAEIDGAPAVRLTVIDDGVGFPPSPPGDRRRAPRGSSFALQFLRDRVVQAGGRIAFRNQEDGGAEVEVVLPVEPPA